MLPFRHIISALLLLALAVPARAQFESQKYKPKSGKAEGFQFNMPNYDARKWHFGFFLAINYTKFDVVHSQYFIDQLNNRVGEFGRPRRPFSGIEPVGSPGFTTGFIASYRLHDLVELRVHPTVSFSQRVVRYHYAYDSVAFSEQLNQSTYSFIELPILLKVKSHRRKNARMFVTAGIKPAFEVGAKRNEIDPDLLRTSSFDLLIDYGFGIDLYYPLFKFSPEIRFSHGLLNMAYPDGNEYEKSLKNLTTHTVTFFFNFN